ncbi:hypothetical protein C8R46DRAFT_1025879 [Mycena filopes]|nr:hypothetical protein C8R46DRAFT_1025879 [Mycena filopes]
MVEHILPAGQTKRSFIDGKAYLLTQPRPGYRSIRMETRIPAPTLPILSLPDANFPTLNLLQALPYLAVEEHFTSSAVVKEFIVIVGLYDFRFFAHYSAELPVNTALKSLLPGFDWRGEIIITSMGAPGHPHYGQPQPSSMGWGSQQCLLKTAINMYFSMILRDVLRSVGVGVEDITAILVPSSYRQIPTVGPVGKWVDDHTYFFALLVNSSLSSIRTKRSANMLPNQCLEEFGKDMSFPVYDQLFSTATLTMMN